MSYFADADDVYDDARTPVRRTRSTTSVSAPLFARANTVIRWEYADPDATITLRLADGERRSVEFGDSQIPAEVTMTMDADVAHQFWLGELNVGVALDARADHGDRPGRRRSFASCPSPTSVVPRYRRRSSTGPRSRTLPPPSPTPAPYEHGDDREAWIAAVKAVAADRDLTLRGGRRDQRRATRRRRSAPAAATGSRASSRPGFWGASCDGRRARGGRLPLEDGASRRRPGRRPTCPT